MLYRFDKWGVQELALMERNLLTLQNEKMLNSAFDWSPGTHSNNTKLSKGLYSYTEFYIFSFSRACVRFGLRDELHKIVSRSVPLSRMSTVTNKWNMIDDEIRYLLSIH